MNKIIISTRPLSDDDIFKEYFSGLGVKVLDFPMIEIAPVEIDEKIRKVFCELRSFQMIIFTSKNGVDCFFQILHELKIDLFVLKSINIAVIGNKTAKEFKKHAIIPDFISSGKTVADMLHELTSSKFKLQSAKSLKGSPFAKAKTSKGKNKILLALGELAGDILEKGLAEIADVTRIDLYKTIETSNHSQEIINIIKNDNYDIIAFTSPSQVRNFMNLVDSLPLTVDKTSKNKQLTTKFACIGKTTEKEILKYGYMPLIVSDKSDALSFAQQIRTNLEI